MVFNSLAALYFSLVKFIYMKCLVQELHHHVVNPSLLHYCSQLSAVCSSCFIHCSNSNDDATLRFWNRSRCELDWRPPLFS